MGLGGVSIWQLLIILIVLLLIFGTQRVKTIGHDLGQAIKNFRHQLNDDHDTPSQTSSRTCTEAVSDRNSVKEKTE